MSFVSDAPLPLPWMPDAIPVSPAFQRTLIGQPQPVRIPKRLWRSWLDNPTVVARFESKRYRRHQHQCWPWIGGVSSTGHGSFPAASLLGPSRRGTVPAHLFAYQLEYGFISRLRWSNTDDAVLCHQCIFAGCTNPTHMRLGTNRSNRSEYELRRRTIASPLADVRGPAVAPVPTPPRSVPGSSRTQESTASKSASLWPRLQDVRLPSGSNAARRCTFNVYAFRCSAASFITLWQICISKPVVLPQALAHRAGAGLHRLSCAVPC